MLFGWFYYDWTVLIVLPALIFTLIAHTRVNSTFEKYSQQICARGLTGAEAARRLLNANGLYHVNVFQTSGHLSDHYNPKDQTIYLSKEVYSTASTAAIGVACHEVGHALQDADAYAPLKARMGMVKACNIGSSLAMPLFFIGLFFAYGSSLGYLFMLAGIACFSLATLFQLITLPVEFNASRRALAGIRDMGILYDDELDGAKQVLTAAAMTYVAALATSLLTLLRLIVIANDRRR